MKNILKTTGLTLLVFLFTACVPEPIYNVKSVKIEHTKKSAEKTYNAIAKAGAKLGWRISKTNEEGKLKGTLHLREHIAIVRINYSASEYSIDYVSSEELMYNEERNEIHKNYNGWIKNLKRDIDINLEFD